MNAKNKCLAIFLLIVLGTVFVSGCISEPENTVLIKTEKHVYKGNENIGVTVKNKLNESIFFNYPLLCEQNYCLRLKKVSGNELQTFGLICNCIPTDEYYIESKKVEFEFGDRSVEIQPNQEIHATMNYHCLPIGKYKVVYSYKGQEYYSNEITVNEECWD